MPPASIYFRTIGTGKSALGVVEQAKAEKLLLEAEAEKTVDEVWTVFDKDDANLSPANEMRFTEAFEKAKNEQIDCQI